MTRMPMSSSHSGEPGERGEPGNPGHGAGHRVPIAHGWSLWQQVGLRGAGFPLHLVMELASAESAAAADRLEGSERRVEEARRRALAALAEATDVLRGEAGRAAGKIARQIRAGGVPDDRPEERLPEPRWQEAVDALRAALAARARALPEAEAAFERERERVSLALRRLGREPRLREAIAWQNRGALRGLDSLLERPPGAADSRTRQNERLLATYVQRYCTKNDTIGFFGPLGWGTLAPDASFSVRPGPSLLGKRTVYFELWALDALAARLTETPGLRPYLAPRLSPLVRLEDAVIHTPFGSVPQPPLHARILAACDGLRTARQIALALVQADPDLAEDAVYAALAELVAREVVLWRLDVPTVGQPAEHALHAQLARVEDPLVRERATTPLAALEAARDDMARSAGDAEALERASARLEETFVASTAAAATRRAGETYAGRSIVYEDCRRDVAFALGAGFVERIARPLSLLLTASRWCSHQVAARYAEELHGIYRMMSTAMGKQTLELTHFYAMAASRFPRTGGVAPAPVQAVFAEYQERWRQALGLVPGVRRIQLSSADLEPRWERLFPAPAPGWPSARHHSPDLMIAAESADAIRDGEYLVVLGELHTFCNTLEQELYFAEHPAPELLREALALDIPTGRIAPVPPKEFAGRCHPTPRSEHPLDVSLEVDDAVSWRPRAQTLPISALVVDERGGRVRVSTRDGARSWDLIEALDLLLTEFNVSILPDAVHTPRVTIDQFVLGRESWRFPVAELPFLARETPLARFTGMRAWAREHGLPRFLFFKPSAEAKPCYLDLESPLYVEGFVKLVRSSQHVTLSEMLPDPDQCWLVDAAGHRYSSELRLVAVDPLPWRST